MNETIGRNIGSGGPGQASGRNGRPEGQRLEAIQPEDQQLENLKPKDQRLEAIQSEDQQLEAIQPEDQQLENLKPKDQQLEDIQPEGQQTEDLKPQGQQLEDLRLEELLAQVEHCIGQLENPRISLEDSFRYYEEGIRKLKICSSKVAQIEQKMMVINSRGELEDF